MTFASLSGQANGCQQVWHEVVAAARCRRMEVCKRSTALHAALPEQVRADRDPRRGLRVAPRTLEHTPAFASTLCPRSSVEFVLV